MAITPVQPAPPAPAPAAESEPPTLPALQAAAKNADEAGGLALGMAGGLDPRNGDPEDDNPTSAANNYEKAGAFDDQTGDQYTKAATNWKEAADKYKAAAEAVKDSLTDTQATPFTNKMKELQKNAAHSKQMAIESYNKAAVEYRKAALVYTDAGDKLRVMIARAKSLDTAAHVGQDSDKKDKKDK